MKVSRVQEKLAKGEPVFGICQMWPAAGTIEAIGGAWDFVWIDSQHGQFTYDTLLECVRACDLVGTSALVRIPGDSYELVGPVLDMAPAGLIVPVVNDAAQARELVQSSRFAPLGARSFGGRRIIDLYGRDYVHVANERQLVIAQIETPEGVANAREIAAVEGIDALFFGPDDMRTGLGLAMDHPLIEEPLAGAVKQVAAAAIAHGKIPMIVAPQRDSLNFVLAEGYRSVVVGGDVPFLKSASAAARKLVDEVAAG